MTFQSIKSNGILMRTILCAFPPLFLLLSGCATTPVDPTEKEMLTLMRTSCSDARRGKCDRAVSAVEEAIRLKPKYADLSRSNARQRAQNNLAWFLATCTAPAFRDGSRAVQLAEQLVKVVPDNAAMLDTLAAAYAEAGRFSDAIRTQEKALALLPASQSARAGYKARLSM